MNSKKLVSAVLTATTVVWMVGAAALPLANAQTTASLQAQIAALLAQIQQLQSQLNSSGSSSSSGAMTYDFTSNLTIGSTGTQVSELQQFLINGGFLTAVSAPTGYFGTLTQAALGKYQASVGISPDAGYFGPITRSYINSLSTTTTTTTGTLPAGCTSTSGYSPTTGASCSTGVTSVTAPATGLSVSLASDNPPAGSLVSSATGSGGGSAARIPVLSFNLTAGNSGAATVSQLVFQKNGVISDSSVANAYLVQNGQVVAQYSSLSNGVLTFSGLDLSIPAGQSEEFQLAVGLSSGSASAGNTVSFSLPSASDVSAFDSSNNAITAAGSFPLNGNVFTVTTVSNPPLATLVVGSSSIGTTVTAGTQGNIVAAYTFNVGVNPVYLENLNFHVIGSANDANIQNVKLMVNGTQVGQTLASVPASGMADFSIPAGSVKLNTGNNNVQVIADIMGSPNMDFQFEILNSYDILAVDSQYNVPITVTNTGGTASSEQVMIQAGQITLSQDSNTPTGNVSKGMSNVVLAKYDLYAAGEPVKVQWLDFNIVLGSVAGGQSLSDELQNVQLVDDAGNQVGTTITTPPSSNTCTPAAGAPSDNYAGGTSSDLGAGTVTYADCFGTSGSPINYIVPANTTRVLSLEANIQPNADFQTILGNLSGDSNNLQGQISSKTTSSGAVSGVTLSLVGSSLTPAVNNALGSQSVSAGTSGVRIGSYSLSASSAEGVNINTVSIELAPGTTTWNNGQTAFQNLKLMINGAQFGTTQGSLAPGGTYVFSGSAFNVPAGQTVNVDVYADTLSNATGTYDPATALTGYTGTGQVSYDSVTYNSTLDGQNISFSGQPALTVTLDNSTPAATQVAQGATGNTLAVFDFLETSNVESVKVTQMNVVDAVASSGVKAAFSNVSLWNGSTELGTAGSPTLDASGTGYIYAFNSFANPLVVPQGGSLSLTLKGDAGTYTNGSITDDTTSTFEIATTTDSTNDTAALTVVARGATSNKTAAVTLSNAVGNPMTILRTSLAAAGAGVGATTGRVKSNSDEIGTITFTPNAAGSAALNTMKITFSGSAQPTLSSSTVWIVDGTNHTYYPASVTTNTATFSFGSAQNGYKMNAGNSYTFGIYLDTATVAGTGSVSQTLTAAIQASTDVSYTDALDGTGVTGLGLPNTTNPAVQINSVSYAQGS